MQTKQQKCMQKALRKTLKKCISYIVDALKMKIIIEPNKINHFKQLHNIYFK